MTYKYNLVLWTLIPALILLSGCSGVRNSLGLDKESPDEFAVVTRAPLEMPPSLALPPPQPGMPRPQETSAVKQAEETLFGERTRSAESASAAESALLQQTGANQADPSIRATINQETKELSERNKPVVKKLLKLGGEEQETSATVVDAPKELERLQQNMKDGKSVTEGETPIIEE